MGSSPAQALFLRVMHMGPVLDPMAPLESHNNRVQFGAVTGTYHRWYINYPLIYCVPRLRLRLAMRWAHRDLCLLSAGRISVLSCMLPEPQMSKTNLNNSRLQILQIDDIDLISYRSWNKPMDRESFRACSALQWGQSARRGRRAISRPAFDTG